jgi:hypothetical protein
VQRYLPSPDLQIVCIGVEVSAIDRLAIGIQDLDFVRYVLARPICLIEVRNKEPFSIRCNCHYGLVRKLCIVTAEE